MVYQKICIFRTGALGDVILTLPVIQNLQHAFPNAKIHLIGNPHLLALANTNHIHNITEAFWASLFAPQTLQAQHAPQLHHIFQDADWVISYLPDPDQSLTKNLGQFGIPDIMTWPPKPTSIVHATDHLLGPLRARAIATPYAKPHIRLTQADHQAILPYVSSHPTLLLHPGSGGKNKCWPPSLFAQTADKLIQQTACRVLISTGPADGDLAQSITHHMTQKAICLPPLPLPHFAALVATCTAYLGNDSGPAHLAAALDKPTIALFGPTNPQIWAPRGPTTHVIQSPNQDMSAILPDRVINILLPFLLPKR